jgi:hypothetical protein
MDNILLFTDGYTFTRFTLIVVLFIFFLWWLMFTSKKDLALEYVVGLIVLIYGVFVFYPYMNNSTANSSLLFAGPTKNIGLTTNDMLIPVVLIAISFLILIFGRPGIEKFYRVYGHQTYQWISFRKKIIDIILLGYRKGDGNRFKFKKFWKMFLFMFWSILVIFLLNEIITGAVYGIGTATRLNNLFYVAMISFIFDFFYKRISELYLSGLANPLFKTFVRFQKREELEEFVNNNIELDTKNKGERPVYTWPIKIISVIVTVILIWFLYEVWKIGITQIFGSYDEFVQITLYGNGKRDGWDFAIRVLFLFKAVFIIYFGLGVLDKIMISDMSLISNIKETKIAGPKALFNTRGVIEYCDFEHSYNSILALFGWIIASVGIFYPIVLGIFMFFMIFRSYSAIDLYNMSQPVARKHSPVFA